MDAATKEVTFAHLDHYEKECERQIILETPTMRFVTLTSNMLYMTISEELFKLLVWADKNQSPIRLEWPIDSFEQTWIDEGQLPALPHLWESQARYANVIGYHFYQISPNAYAVKNNFIVAMCEYRNDGIRGVLSFAPPGSELERLHRETEAARN